MKSIEGYLNISFITDIEKDTIDIKTDTNIKYNDNFSKEKLLMEILYKTAKQICGNCEGNYCKDYCMDIRTLEGCKGLIFTR
jgi:hypothetical protein